MHQLVSRRRHVGQGGNPHRRRQADIEPVAGQELVGRYTLPDALTDRKRTLAPGVGENQGKLVAAEARHDVGFARAPANDRRRLDQRAAAAEMPCLSLTPLKPSNRGTAATMAPLRDARFVSRRRTEFMYRVL